MVNTSNNLGHGRSRVYLRVVICFISIDHVHEESNIVPNTKNIKSMNHFCKLETQRTQN